MPDGADGPVEVPGLREIQRRVAEFWRSTDVPARAWGGRPGGPVFRFTEGPPTANGAPHIGHLLARTLKDVQLRYRRMRGDAIVSPMAGWDCHGLPVELEVEKRHGFRSKKEIESYGVERFCAECRAGTLEVAATWEAMSDALGYWLDYRRAYLTMSAPYIESVWWSLQTLFDRGLLEKGFRNLPYCPRCETSLSSHEVALGYRETTDPSVTVRFRLAGGVPRSLLVWTTTPWTLPANLLVAARADLAYVGVRAADGGEEILAEAALPRLGPSAPEIVARYTGRELAGLAYDPLFPFAGPGPGRYRVVLDDMVDAAEGTGLVHIAPSFGPEDQRIGEREGVGTFDPLDGRGVFTEAVPPVAGRRFKDADAPLLADLEGRGRLARSETLRHTYPFCWRCSHALLYRNLDSWFVRTRKLTEQLVRNNATVTWVPEHLRDGRFGNFLAEAKDWALSRTRYWGTPLPVWSCPEGHATCLGSFEELARRAGGPLPTPFDPHRTTVDGISFPCPKCGATARREPYTIDAWYDSGAAPFAQYHYPFEPGPFRPDAPLDYVAEGLDQTRGWFYTMLVLATALFDRPAYRACVANGLVLDETGAKMSKSRGNAIEPMALLERLGADTPRWGFLLADYTAPLRADETAMRQAANRTLGTLVHVAAFYRQNAQADALLDGTRELSPVHPLDRWILSRLEGTRGAVESALEAFDPREGAIALRGLVDDLSTWYLRRSRPRFWNETEPSDRRAANATLAAVLGGVARLLAPYAPYTAEYVAQQIRPDGFATADASVHLSGWPAPSDRRDPALEGAMAQVRAEVEVGRALRMRVGVKSRIPLERFVLVGSPAPEALGPTAGTLLAEELNVRTVERIGPERLEAFPADAFERAEDDAGRVRALLSRTPTESLRREGLVRETLRRLQSLRKESGLAYLDRVAIEIRSEGSLLEAIEGARERIAAELLADAVTIGPIGGGAPEGLRLWTVGPERLAARLDRTGPTGETATPGPR